ncbi:MAG TPA: ATP-binding protein [Anaerolineales bacterium]|nr:ATP-binding protein [Anaerolineales bacterium]
MTLPSGRCLGGYLAGVAAVAAATLFLSPLSFSLSGGGVTVASVLLLTVVLTATTWGVGPGVLSALIATLCLNILYTGAQTTTGDQVIGSAAFLLTAFMVGRLSTRARRNQWVKDPSVAINQASDRASDQASELEAAKRNEQFKSILLDTVTHDFRTPLTSIKAAATTLLKRDPSLSPSQSRASQKLIETIVQQSDRLDQFIEGMIELAKAESASGRSEQATESAPLEEIFAAALSRAEDLLRHHRVTVTCDDDLYVAANPRAIAQALFSLLENAARYSPPGTGIHITASLHNSDSIDVAVEDEGPGVPPDLREGIFEKFVRGSGPHERAANEQGLGIGLAIARGIVTANRGTIRVEDRPARRRGARFVFTLPAGAHVSTLQPERALRARA